MAGERGSPPCRRNEGARSEEWEEAEEAVVGEASPEGEAGDACCKFRREEEKEPTTCGEGGDRSVCFKRLPLEVGGQASSAGGAGGCDRPSLPSLFLKRGLSSALCEAEAGKCSVAALRPDLGLRRELEEGSEPRGLLLGGKLPSTALLLALPSRGEGAAVAAPATFAETEDGIVLGLNTAGMERELLEGTERAGTWRGDLRGDLSGEGEACPEAVSGCRGG